MNKPNQITNSHDVDIFWEFMPTGIFMDDDLNGKIENDDTISEQETITEENFYF